MPTTTGFNTTAQANAILAELRTELAALGVGTVTRGRLWQIPARPCAVLVGPAIELAPEGLHVEDAKYTWLLIIARDVEDHDRRADEIDTWADTAMAAIMDVCYTTGTFSIAGGEGPHRLEDDRLLQLMERMSEAMDVVAIQFATHTNIYPPP